MFGGIDDTPKTRRRRARSFPGVTRIPWVRTETSSSATESPATWK